MANFKKEHAWIEKKVKQGVNKETLHDSIGIFSDKKKSKVMQDKKISAKEYNSRREFLSNVYYILENNE
mgnify:CR=1 FL=1